ncbi:hypothetical protein CKJ63_25465 [Mycobacterium avium]|uniref:DUF4192 domain-containing protein n=1 Tax=Mycobacterium avium TaxID=1764 RepID=UPI000BAF8E3A|nr:DUF4192 domain-containing protein [Mycobacterium avium]PBA38814.1 hypothetical protein CKJ63_25465 [Mycobacterium avium]PBA78725.1 hypothetical protein CKJ72_25505 [Mycobacterium avium]
MFHLNIDDNAEILAAIPAILRFTPEAGIIVLLLHTGDGQDEVRNALRFDIDPTAARQLTSVAAPAFHDVTSAILVAVCGDWIADHAATTLDIVRDGLAELDIATLVRLITPSLDQPGHWTDIDSGERGPVASFRDSVFAAETVMAGDRIAANRDEIVAEFTPTTNPVPIVNVDPAEFLIDTFETIAAIITGSAHAASHPDLATRVSLLIQDVHLRDTLLLLSVDHAAPAARLWTHLANQLTGAARLEILTMAAACYYAASDTIRAGIALDTAALDANAQRLDYPRLAELLLTALQAGFSPTQVREVLSRITIRHQK